jgi:hypothetical protein
MLHKWMALGTSKYLVLAIVLLICTICISSCLELGAESAADDPGTLSRVANKARHDGKSSIDISAPDELWAEPEPLDEALSHTTVVIATEVASDVGNDREDIVTWHKYKLFEKLSSQSFIRNEPLPQETPSSLLPLAEGEFLVPEIGGTANIEGITIREHSNRDGILPKQQRHLMFLIFRCSGALAVPNYGPASFFWLDNSDNIQAPIQGVKDKFRNGVLTRTGGKLSTMRTLASQRGSAGPK